MIELMRRYRLARRWRTCPKCHGKGSDVFDTILRHNFREQPCALCGGSGRVQYKRSVALGVARRGRVDHESEVAA